ncbi:hypothetical protein CYMTET_27227 [Cymbomonas tetramitiformis]|uniref:Uncharacterized protein n=1 Tax=Cymbomonas tetramitiformis TaxID=36881 RepID=A0AAE0KXF4_9CHLO|nr:hypothetical protein CYMTET_27227 [Cymbomonas tetramitiformis]
MHCPKTRMKDTLTIFRQRIVPHHPALKATLFPGVRGRRPHPRLYPHPHPHRLRPYLHPHPHLPSTAPAITAPSVTSTSPPPPPPSPPPPVIRHAIETNGLEDFARLPFISGLLVVTLWMEKALWQPANPHYLLDMYSPGVNPAYVDSGHGAFGTRWAELYVDGEARAGEEAADEMRGVVDEEGGAEV